MLVKQHCDVHVIMTQNATHFIHPITFETLTGNKCLVDTFDRNFQFHVAHVSLAEKADLFLIAPASANAIGKIANGISDDMLTTTVMAAKCPIYIAPAMNTNMYENRIMQDNLNKLISYGYHIIETASGRLACGSVGKGKLPSEEVLMNHILRELACKKDLQGLRILVTAGPTQEAIDPVRYITNHSSGKMGYAIARRAMLRGASVTLISGPVSLTPPPFVDVIPVISAEDMYQAVTSRAGDTDWIIKSAAVADYRPVTIADDKIKKNSGEMSIPLTRTKDILKELGSHKQAGQLICGFSMETQNMVENSQKKLTTKNVDMIAANNLKESGAGFQTDTNRITLIKKDEIIPLDLMSKEEAADQILTELLHMRAAQTV
jgi:phosphopantothenoylcysteine decarboxylase/phosphopantothenate--cysteine ligase